MLQDLLMRGKLTFSEFHTSQATLLRQEAAAARIQAAIRGHAQRKQVCIGIWASQTALDAAWDAAVSDLLHAVEQSQPGPPYLSSFLLRSPAGQLLSHGYRQHGAALPAARLYSARQPQPRPFRQLCVATEHACSSRQRTQQPPGCRLPGGSTLQGRSTQLSAPQLHLCRLSGGVMWQGRPCASSTLLQPAYRRP